MVTMKRMIDSLKVNDYFPRALVFSTKLYVFLPNVVFPIKYNLNDFVAVCL